jgi:UDP:flavonoid glycosyltransferase YjiC (YdhE family)
MSRTKVDVFAPPFAGHLHPALGVARVLSEWADVRVLSTPDVAERVAAAGLAFHPILAGREAAVWGIPNTAKPVRGRPWMLWKQFRENLKLLPVLRAEVESAWRERRPELAVVDFTLPSVGHWAEAAGIRWWTTHPSPLAIETPDGTPTYLGGWYQPETVAGKVRDAVGRTCVRVFKRAVFAAVREELRRVGVRGVYRRDGTEAVYSEEAILALGARELEFACTWPETVRFVGPVFYTPSVGMERKVPAMDVRRKNVLVTIGTHLPYARGRVLAQVKRWAAERPEVFFHYTRGGLAVEGSGSAAGGSAGGSGGAGGENWRVYRYVNYEREVARFDAVVHHGGAGITYHCLRAGVPAVVWPQDYDQFDFAARLAARGLALRCERAGKIAVELKRVLADDVMRGRCEEFARVIAAYDLRERVRAVWGERGLG